ncbi:hypothetical protein [Xenorhabdus japonica]|uniref:hypothetical protein n=1 Tax=Xenorhabdus japonica TaxID=53341 RepID=UPI0015871B6D|nr:hypothetical protein [Xenorhabdus japonica]
MNKLRQIIADNNTGKRLAPTTKPQVVIVGASYELSLASSKRQEISYNICADSITAREGSMTARYTRTKKRQYD